MTTAKNAAIAIQRSITVWTGETGINGDSLHLGSENAFQFIRKGIVAFR